MPQLDPLLQALLDREGEELILADGQKPSFRIGGALRPVAQKDLNRSQIAALLSEIADQIQAARIAEGQSASFVYRLAGAQPFRCQVRQTGGSLRARLTPGGEESPPTMVTPAPVTVTPAPVAVATAPAAAAPARETAPPPPVRRPGAPEIDRYLMRMVEMEASDLHLSAQEVPMVRQHGEMLAIPGEDVVSPEKAIRILGEIMPDRNRREYDDCHDTDFAYEIPDVARFRVNVFTDRKGPGGVLRVIPTKILTAEDLNLSSAILDLCRLSKGLVLVTGPTGSGKSTTLAAMVDHINRSRSDHIITIEDPIEFVHPNRKCLVNQREVITHTSGFKKALRAALREDPDIVLVGEMRDLETIAIAIETAETGHLVFGTLHTTTACSTVDRIIDQFPADRQAQIRTMLAGSLKGVISQTLLKKVGGGRVAALEVLIVTAAISNLIREGKTFQIPSLMQTGKNIGMGLLNDALMDLVRKKLVDPVEAFQKAVEKSGFKGLLRTAGINIDIAADA